MASGMPIENDQLNPQTQQLGQQLPPIPQSMPQMSPMSPMMPQMSLGGLQTSPEELVEAIIEEKWNDLVKDINKVIEWKQKADAKIVAMEQQVLDLQSQFDKLHQAIIGKVGDYDKHILEVGTQLQAMEKVFGKVLPTFIDNVSELSAITQRVKNERIEAAAERTERVARTPDKIVEKKTVKKSKSEED
jgi:hypothetical protein